MSRCAHDSVSYSIAGMLAIPNKSRKQEKHAAEERTTYRRNMPDVLTARWTAQLNTKTECVPPPRDSPPTRKTPHRKYSSTSLSAADRIQKKNPSRKDRSPKRHNHLDAGQEEYIFFAATSTPRFL